MEWWVILAVLVLVGFVVWRAPFFRSVWERNDREPIIDNKVVTPREENLSLEDEVRRAEEQGTLDEHGMTRE